MRMWFIQSLKIGAILALIGALVWLITGGCIAGYRMHWKACCEKVTGTVIAYESSNNPNNQSEASQSLYTVFRYKIPHTNESKTGKSSVAIYPPSHAIGDKIDVLVHPDTPNEAKINSYEELYILPTVLMYTGLLMLAVSLLFLYFFRRLSHTKG